MVIPPNHGLPVLPPCALCHGVPVSPVSGGLVETGEEAAPWAPKWKAFGSTWCTTPCTACTAFVRTGTGDHWWYPCTLSTNHGESGHAKRGERMAEKLFG